MNLQGEGNTADGLDGLAHNPGKPSRAKHQRHRPPAAIIETKRYLCQKTQVIGNAKRTERRKRMSVVQMKMHRFAQRTETLHQIEDRDRRCTHCRFDVCHDLWEQGVLRLEFTDVLAGMNL